ncbi:MAG: hypothetical protein ACRC76_05070 [Proteocatella sp.]
MKFRVDMELLETVKAKLENCSNIFWLVGGSCSGKSTISRMMEEKFDYIRYDMDEYIFGKYMDRYSKELHPANSAWFGAENPLDWALSFPNWEEYNEFNMTSMVEQLSLFCEDIELMDKDEKILVDGGITNPDILAKVLNKNKICCLNIEDELCRRIWSKDESRLVMKDMIYELPSPDYKWNKFLELNDLINKQMETECRDNDINIIFRGEEELSEDVLEKVMNAFGRI